MDSLFRNGQNPARFGGDTDSEEAGKQNKSIRTDYFRQEFAGDGQGVNNLMSAGSKRSSPVLFAQGGSSFQDRNMLKSENENTEMAHTGDGDTTGKKKRSVFSSQWRRQKREREVVAVSNEFSPLNELNQEKNTKKKLNNNQTPGELRCRKDIEELVDLQGVVFEYLDDSAARVLVHFLSDALGSNEGTCLC